MYPGTPAMRTTSGAALLALSLANASAVAQPRDGARRAPAEPVSLAATVVRHLVVAPGDPVDALDPAVAPVMVFTADGALLVTRDRAGGLSMAHLDAALHRADAPRTLCAPAEAYAMVHSPPGHDGAAVLYVERDREVVLATVDPAGAARNVPRMLLRADEPVTAVALCPTDGGWATAWTTATGAAWVTWVDLLGVPRVAPRRVADGASPRLTWLPASQSTALVLAPGGASTEALAVLFGTDGTVVSRTRWPAGALGPVEIAAAMSTVQLAASGAPSLVRVGSAGPLALEPGAPPREGMSLAAVADAGGVVAVLLTDLRGQRQAVACITPDAPAGAAVAVTVRAGATTPGSLAVRGDGAVFALARETGAHGAQRLGAAQVTCRR